MQESSRFSSKSSFVDRKLAHLQLSGSARSLHLKSNGLEKIQLPNEPLADLRFAEVRLHTKVFGVPLLSPCFVSSMTAGHAKARSFNQNLVAGASESGWGVAVGSQRRELTNREWSKEWAGIRRGYPKVALFGNLGIAEVTNVDIGEIQRLVDSLEAKAFFIHLNPLQELFQLDGARDFVGGAKAIARLVKRLSVPVVVKEVGFGLGPQTLQRLIDLGVAGIDVAGAGGTNWALIEGLRSKDKSDLRMASQCFADWGYPLADALVLAKKSLVSGSRPKGIRRPVLLASGGLQNGVEAAKCVYLGADMCGYARAFVEPALKSSSAVLKKMRQIDLELRIAVFATGSTCLKDLQGLKDL